jgi:hypothetical protein
MSVTEIEPKQRVAGPSLVPPEPAIDRAHLAQMTLGDKRLEEEVLRLFDRQAELLLGRMSGAQPAAVAAFAHTLKGSARGVGLWQVAEAADALERAAVGTGAVEPAVGRLAGAVAVARVAIGDLLSET